MAVRPRLEMLPGMLSFSSHALDRVRIGDCMRPTILSCAPDTPITDILAAYAVAAGPRSGS